MTNTTMRRFVLSGVDHKQNHPSMGDANIVHVEIFNLVHLIYARTICIVNGLGMEFYRLETSERQQRASRGALDETLLRGSFVEKSILELGGHGAIGHR